MASSPKRLPAGTVQQRTRTTIELFETAQRIMRQNLRRRFPDLDAGEIEHKLMEWRHHRPGAEFGDGVGKPIPRDKMDAWLASKKS